MVYSTVLNHSPLWPKFHTQAPTRFIQSLPTNYPRYRLTNQSRTNWQIILDLQKFLVWDKNKDKVLWKYASVLIRSTKETHLKKEPRGCSGSLYSRPTLISSPNHKFDVPVSLRYHNIAKSIIYRHIVKGTQRQFSENIFSEDDFRSRIFGAFVVKFLACLSLLGFSNI